MTIETQWTEDEQQVFLDLGIGEHESLKRLIRGQRKINGKFFLAIQTIIECFEPKAGLDENAKERVQAALKFVREIPDVDPPRCEDPSKPPIS
jgi:hypothetical protein